MRDDQLDRVLAAGEDIVPSSGFVEGVMEAVRREASAPPPIPFPWKRALPGLAAWAIVIVSVAAVSFGEFGRQSPAPPVAARLPAQLVTIFEAANAGGAGWVALALLLSAASLLLSMRLAGGRR